MLWKTLAACSSWQSSCVHAANNALSIVVVVVVVVVDRRGRDTVLSLPLRYHMFARIRELFHKVLRTDLKSYIVSSERLNYPDQHCQSADSCSSKPCMKLYQHVFVGIYVPSCLRIAGALVGGMLQRDNYRLRNERLMMLRWGKCILTHEKIIWNCYKSLYARNESEIMPTKPWA